MPYIVKKVGSARHPRYEVWPGCDLGSGNFQEIGREPEQSFRDRGGASRFCSKVNEQERQKK